MIDVGLVGFGLAGRSFHAPVIRAVPGLRLAAIVQRNGNEAATLYPDVRIVRTLVELLSMKEIRLVVIATPNDSHFQLAHRCLVANRDVLVDKPFTTSLQKANTLVQFAKKQGRLITVYQNRRYDGDFQAILQLVASGALGRIVRFESNYDRYRPLLRPGAWREKSGPGSGIFFDIAPHLIDHALLLFGVPEAVTADIRIEREGAVADDAFDLAFHYPRGLRADLRSSILAVTTRPRFLLHGTNGAFLKQTFDPQENNLRHGRIPAEGAWGAEPEENWGLLTLAENGGLTQRRVPSANCDYRDFYANLRDALLGKAKPAVTPEWALDVMRLMELARQSSHERRTIAVPPAEAGQLPAEASI
ncbi:MAG TPA: Gfo/Idh/MocA family oxidoreductase [Candidatus Solibacter sp.]|nr:Gfo/Idh/MocA family oxidoreductase [Candidatus Solibacter sp.]